MKKYLVTIVALLLIFIVYSSFLRENVVITREYIYCNDWGGAPSATIKRIIPSEFLKSRKLEELESKDTVVKHVNKIYSINPVNLVTS